MTIEVRPLGVKCNIECRYCYQTPQRDARNVLHKFDLEKIKAAIETASRETGEKKFSVFGGEPLLVPTGVLEELWAWGHARFGVNGIQTNGTLVSDAHVELFKRYNVQVGISVDGPGELNDLRWHRDLARTREATAKTHEAIERLCKEHRAPSLIVTLSRYNATRDKLPRMNAWLRELETMGVRSVRLHLLEVDDETIRGDCALTDEENIEALTNFCDLESEVLTTMRFDLFREMRRLLVGKDSDATCIWKACDPLTTRAVRGIEGNGQLSNCGRTNKEGIDFVKSDAPGFERYLALYNTPQDEGGCKDCRFFLMCKGQCPGTALDGDWRNRTEHCEVWKALFQKLERELLERGDISLSTSPLRGSVEEEILGYWANGENPSIEHLLTQRMKGQQERRGAGPAA